MADFLTKNRGEAIAMSIFEFDAEKEWKMFREAEYQNGVDDGIEQGKRLAILEILNDLGEIPSDVSEPIMSVKDTGILKEMLKLASQCNSLEQFQKKLAVKQKV